MTPKQQKFVLIGCGILLISVAIGALYFELVMEDRSSENDATVRWSETDRRWVPANQPKAVATDPKPVTVTPEVVDGWKKLKEESVATDTTTEQPKPKSRPIWFYVGGVALIVWFFRSVWGSVKKKK